MTHRRHRLDDGEDADSAPPSPPSTRYLPATAPPRIQDRATATGRDATARYRDAIGDELADIIDADDNPDEQRKVVRLLAEIDAGARVQETDAAAASPRALPIRPAPGLIRAR
jgi:hypothetical protein